MMKTTQWSPAFAAWLVLWLPVCCMADGRNDTDLPPSHSVKPELFASGFKYTEGPAFDRQGNLYCVNYREVGTIGRVTPDGTASIFCDLRKLLPRPAQGRRPEAHGMKVNREGQLIVADLGGRVIRLTPSPNGKPPRLELLADRFEGKTFVAPNDVALDLQGNVYFSDPGAWEPDKPDSKRLLGAIYRYDVQTKQLARLDAGLGFPNGLAVSPDQKHLCVAESYRHRVLIYDRTADGGVCNRRVLSDFMQPSPGNRTGDAIVPDGLIFDAVGRLYAATWTGGVINVVDVPSGRFLRQYDAGGDRATNLHFNRGFLYTTVGSREAVFRLKLGVEGFDYRQTP